MKYISTRGNSEFVTSAEAIKLGMVPAGGLFVPENIPSIDKNFLTASADWDYNTLSNEILNMFLTDYTREELQECVALAYNTSNFDRADIAPLVKVEDSYILELWHGPTAAFKDMALQILPQFLVKAIKKTGTDKEVVILVATSGDTGKAALEGFKNVPGTKIICFYPHNGVSKIQELQMTTTDGENTYVVAVNGNFDDCQTAVKNIFGDKLFAERAFASGYELSSANSINWGRLVPQIIYYFWTYAELLRNKDLNVGDKINLVVPTGNFGNILAAYYAYKMGLPVNRFICASNNNNVLTDFLASGVYDKRRTFHQTLSPSMDIIISSNLERFLFEITGHNEKLVSNWLNELQNNGFYEIDSNTKEKITSIMEGGCADEEATTKTIHDVFKNTGYVLDPHTAVAYDVYKKYRAKSQDTTLTIITATANPYKFNAAVLNALTTEGGIKDEFEMVKELNSLTNMPVHNALKELDIKPVLHNIVVETNQLLDITEKILKI